VAQPCEAPSPVATGALLCEEYVTRIERTDSVEWLRGENFLRVSAINNLGQVALIRGGNGQFEERAINDSGVVVGQRYHENRFQGFQSANGIPVSLPIESDESHASSINNRGDIIGARHDYFILPFLPRPGSFGGNFLIQDGQIYNVDRLLQDFEVQG
jgi:hypothetical protein